MIDGNIGSVDEYQQLFKIKGVPFLMAEIISGHYRSLDCVFLLYEGTWLSFLPKMVVEKTLQDGFELYSNEERFTEYKFAFEDYQRRASVVFERLVAQPELTKEDMGLFLDLATDLFLFYSKTDFFYTDKAFLEASSYPTLKCHLSEFEAIKNTGRLFLNTVFYGTDTRLSRVLSILGRQFEVDSNVLVHYSRAEILALFDGKRVKDDIIAQRRQAYVLVAHKGEIDVLYGSRAESVCRSFLEIDGGQKTVLRGVCANKGYKRGIVKVILYDYEAFHNMPQLIAEMDKGAILVAETTSPEMFEACHKAGAIVTNQGGLLSHAAIISRELGIPCVVGTRTATDFLHDGDEVEVDADQGVVRLLK
ncbi:hypothetical protein KBD61_03925 [Patescibacteria group bacterium]|nr:hypothetical protein [Patescibacteria group bacterium]MBP9710144.1 hypothetical protein [Patescibacteria group bacterium]